MKTKNETGKANHTPGPWKHNETWGLITYGKQEIAALHSGNVANARLISAAPELLEALLSIAEHAREFADLEDSETMVARMTDKARAAIAKATGSSED